jgi:hypothetical protein
LFENFFLHVHEARFDSKSGMEIIGSICDPWIQEQVRRFLDCKPLADQWKEFCDLFVQVRRKDHLDKFLPENPTPDAAAWVSFFRAAFDRRNDPSCPKEERGGSLITHVHRVIGKDPAVYPDLSEDKTGIHVTQTGNLGYFPYKITTTDEAGNVATSYAFRVVRAFESPGKVKKELLLQKGLELLDTECVGKPPKMWKNKMLFRLCDAVAAGKTKVEPGIYLLDSVQNEASAYLVPPNGQKITNPIGLKKLLEKGFWRIS